MSLFKHRRARIRLISFIAACFVVAVGFAVSGYMTANKLRMNIEYSYERSLSELSDHMDNISLDLEKAQYAGTSAQLMGLASKIRMESSAAATALSQISITDVNFESTTKFITQAGDYANSLAKSLTRNNKLTDEQRKSLSTLYKNASKLARQLDDIVSDTQTGRITLFKTEEALGQFDNNKAQSVSTITSGFQSIEEDMSNLPTLIYDGPFSDNVLKKNPEFTKGKAVVSRDAARNTAAAFIGVTANKVADDGETSGNLPTYNFKCGTKSIYVSKNGGYVVRMIDSRSPSTSKIDTKKASELADAFLKSRKITNITQTYSLSNNNICVFNCAYKQGEVTCYTDLVKVGIALDNGEVISYDATGYIMNHKERNFPQIKVSEAEARAQLSPALTVQKVSLALIPVDGTREALCYEFKCTAENGKRNVIDYFNVTNNYEEQVLILTETPGGTLAM